MRVQPGSFRTRSSQPETALAGPASSRSSFASHSSFWPDFCTNVKKGALRLVQSAHNSFVINIIFQKLRRKNAKKRSKLTLIRPFSGCFRGFSAPRPFAGLPPRQPAFRTLFLRVSARRPTVPNPCLKQSQGSSLLATGYWLFLGMGGMGRYGRGMGRLVNPLLSNMWRYGIPGGGGTP